MSRPHPGSADGAIEWVQTSVRRRYRSLALGIDRVGELVQVGVEDPQEAKQGMPADAAMAVLDLRDVGGADIDAARQRLLREPGSVAQRPQRSPEDHVGISV